MYVLRTYLRPLVGLGHPHSQTQDPTTIIVQLNTIIFRLILRRESQGFGSLVEFYDNLSDPVIISPFNSTTR